MADEWEPVEDPDMVALFQQFWDDGIDLSSFVFSTLQALRMEMEVAGGDCSPQ